MNPSAGNKRMDISHDRLIKSGQQYIFDNNLCQLRNIQLYHEDVELNKREMFTPHKQHKMLLQR